MTICLIISNLNWTLSTWVSEIQIYRYQLDNILRLYIPISLFTTLSCKLSAYRPFDGYISWLHSYVTSDSVVQIHGIYPTPLVVHPGVYDLPMSHYCLMYLLITSAILLNTLDIFLFAAADKIFHTVSSVTDCTLQQSDTDSLHSWCAADGMKLNIYKTGVITFTRKTDAVNYEGSSKSFRTFIFSRETVRAGVVVIGHVWECHVTSQSGKPADPAV